MIENTASYFRLLFYVILSKAWIFFRTAVERWSCSFLSSFTFCQLNKMHELIFEKEAPNCNLPPLLPVGWIAIFKSRRNFTWNRKSCISVRWESSLSRSSAQLGAGLRTSARRMAGHRWPPSRGRIWRRPTGYFRTRIASRCSENGSKIK